MAGEVEGGNKGGRSGRNESADEIGKSSEQGSVGNDNFGSGGDSGNCEIGRRRLGCGGIIRGEILESGGAGGEKIGGCNRSGGGHVRGGNISGDQGVALD